MSKLTLSERMGEEERDRKNYKVHTQVSSFLRRKMKRGEGVTDTGSKQSFGRSDIKLEAASDEDSGAPKSLREDRMI